MRKYLVILFSLFITTAYGQQYIHGNATEKYTGAYEHRVVSSTNDTTFRVDAATGNLTNKGITKSRRFWATDTIGSGNAEPAFNVERTLSGVNSLFGVGYNERTTIVGGQSANYTGYLAQTNIGASATGKYGLYITYYSNPGVNVLDTLLEHRGMYVFGAINNVSGRVRDWYGFYYQQPSGSGQIYNNHIAIFCGLQTKGTNRWFIQSASSAPSNISGRLGISANPVDTVPKAILHLGGGGTAANSAPIKIETGSLMTVPEAGAIEYNGTHWYATVTGGVRYQLDQQATGKVDSITKSNDTFYYWKLGVKYFAGLDATAGGGGGIGTVTSVSMTTPTWLTVSGSPVTTSGTLAVTAATGQTANRFVATPDGSTGAVSLRAIATGDLPTGINAANLADGSVSNTEFQYIGGLTSDAQTQIDGKAASSHTHAQSDITNLTTDLAGKQASDADLTAIAALTPTNDDIIQRKAGAWTNRTMAQLKTDLALVKGDVGLGNVDNTSDATKNSAVAVLTNKDLTSGTNTFPTFNQNTTGSAATLTTTRTIWGQNFNGSANVTGDITLGTSSITMTGSIGATGARVTKGWFTDIESTNVPTVGGVALPTASSTTTLTNKTIAYGSNTITGLPVEIGIAVSDETTAITTGTAKVTFRMPHAMTVTAVRANVNTVSSSGTPTVDINEGGSSILGTKLTIDASEKTSTTAASAATITDASLADDAEITIDIDVAGTGAKGLKVWIIGTR